MNVSEELIRQIVQKVLEEQKKAGDGEDFVKEKDPSGIIKIATGTVKCEPFKQEGVSLKDVVTLEEAPRMGCGIMELDHTSFEWTLTYDEYDMVIDGTLAERGPRRDHLHSEEQPYSFPDADDSPVRVFCISC